jgi:4-amino-4-deoxy-L-arabinose transferase-like glycosyltransferase
VFALFAALLLASHAPLLRLPYFWDEAGYYIPAARDLLSGSLIPYSTPSNAHPPLVLGWLALSWKIFGYSPVVTRCAMLFLAAFSLLGFFRLARSAANTMVATASTFLTAIYPVFFAQSSLAQVDLPAAGLIFWGLNSYVRRRRGASIVWFALAALAKETAILAPLALFAWELLGPRFHRTRPLADAKTSARETLVLLIAVIPLALWYGYHYARTGFVFGNPEFFRYNVQGTLHPLRIFLALLLRTWQTVGYLNLYLLTLACVLAMRNPPLEGEGGPRRRIDISVQASFLSITVVYLLALSVLGGAVLARYMLPVVPLVVLVCVSTIWRRLRLWKLIIAIVAVAFVAALFINPPYGFSPEDNLAYRDYIRLHQQAETLLEQKYAKARVLTAWPASDELTHPYLGYVQKPFHVVRIEDFTAEQLLSAADARAQFDVALVFSTKYQPPHSLFDRWRLWQRWKSQYFGYHRDLTPAAAASVLGGNLVYVKYRHGQWVAIIELVKIEDARLGSDLKQRADDKSAFSR